MLITPTFRKSLIVEQFQGNYLNFVHIEKARKTHDDKQLYLITPL